MRYYLLKQKYNLTHKEIAKRVGKSRVEVTRTMELTKLPKNIKIDIDVDSNIISIFNDGNGIDVVKFNDTDIYIPELIFGHLLTSSNYNKNQKKIVGGKNGYGAKLANIFSTEFIVDTVDHYRKKRFYQKFQNNMTKKSKPLITDKVRFKIYKILFGFIFL